MPDMEKDDARVLLQSTQQLRIHWSDVIVRNISYAIMLNVAIWGIFLKEYVDKGEHQYIFWAALLSSIAIILWRWYTHYLDKQIANLYPEMVFYQAKLGAPDEAGTWGYLKRNVFQNAIKELESKNDEEVLEKLEKLCPGQRKKAVRAFVNEKRIGCRGHNTIDIISLVAIVIMWAIIIWHTYSTAMFKGSAIFSILSLFFFIFIFCYYFQKDPSVSDIKEALSEVKKETKDTA